MHFDYIFGILVISLAVLLLTDSLRFCGGPGEIIGILPGMFIIGLTFLVVIAITFDVRLLIRTIW